MKQLSIKIINERSVNIKITPNTVAKLQHKLKLYTEIK